MSQTISACQCLFAKGGIAALIIGLHSRTGPVKDAHRGEADSLTGTGGCVTQQTARNSPMNPGTLPSGIPEIVVIY